MEFTKSAELRPYEGIVIVHPDTPEDDQKALFKRNKSIIEGFRGSVNHLDTWGKRALANPINSLKRAIYFHTTFQAAPEAIAELERTMRINDRVLRFMHARLEDETDLGAFVEDFKKQLADTATREREREAKFQARRAASSHGRGPRREDGERFDRGGDRGGDRGDRGGDRGDRFSRRDDSGGFGGDEG